jgi:hypothetical protein
VGGDRAAITDAHDGGPRVTPWLGASGVVLGPFAVSVRLSFWLPSPSSIGHWWDHHSMDFWKGPCTAVVQLYKLVQLYTVRTAVPPVPNWGKKGL